MINMYSVPPEWLMGALVPERGGRGGGLLCKEKLNIAHVPSSLGNLRTTPLTLKVLPISLKAKLLHSAPYETHLISQNQHFYATLFEVIG